MSYEMFFKKNQKLKSNVKFPATKALIDENGDPLLWEIKPIPVRTYDAIRIECTREIPIPGKFGMYREKIDSDRLQVKLICASVVYPDLNNKELQDSYGVMGAEELVKEMIGTSGELMQFSEFIQKYNDFEPLQEKVDEAKN